MPEHVYGGCPSHCALQVGPALEDASPRQRLSLWRSLVDGCKIAVEETPEDAKVRAGGARCQCASSIGRQVHVHVPNARIQESPDARPHTPMHTHTRAHALVLDPNLATKGKP